jgi:hypothetical protein
MLVSSKRSSLLQTDDKLQQDKILFYNKVFFSKAATKFLNKHFF